MLLLSIRRTSVTRPQQRLNAYRPSLRPAEREWLSMQTIVIVCTRANLCIAFLINAYTLIDTYICTLFTEFYPHIEHFTDKSTQIITDKSAGDKKSAGVVHVLCKPLLCSRQCTCNRVHHHPSFLHRISCNRSQSSPLLLLLAWPSTPPPTFAWRLTLS